MLRWNWHRRPEIERNVRRHVLLGLSLVLVSSVLSSCSENMVCSAEARQTEVSVELVDFDPDVSLSVSCGHSQPCFPFQRSPTSWSVIVASPLHVDELEYTILAKDSSLVKSGDADITWKEATTTGQCPETYMHATLTILNDETR